MNVGKVIKKLRCVETTFSGYHSNNHQLRNDMILCGGKVTGCLEINLIARLAHDLLGLKNRETFFE